MRISDWSSDVCSSDLFSVPGEDPELKRGDVVEVYLERMEDKNGEAMLSREKARREEAWTQLEEAFNKGERVTGSILGRVKGGFTVALQGAVAFLPASQVDIRSDERRVGNAGVGTCSSRWSQ